MGVTVLTDEQNNNHHHQALYIANTVWFNDWLWLGQKWSFGYFDLCEIQPVKLVNAYIVKKVMIFRQ